MWQNSYDNSPTLYLIPTPIGNMEDITYRAINVLKSVDIIFSEDTRVTSILLKYYNINKKLVSLHDHNEDVVKNKVLDCLKEGLNVGLVTDRGTPIISDPGYKTVKYVSSNGFNVVALPGPCAFVPALITSGINPMPFIFYGFLDSKESKCRNELENLKYNVNTIIFYEAPHRIYKTLKLILDIFGDREISLSREISKKFESIYRGSISNIIDDLDGIKGEFVIVVSGYVSVNNNIEMSIYDNVNLLINNGFDKMNAIKMVAKERGISKGEVYSLYHKEGLK
ncbi:MAG: 16S rRNA (cytidine(1402)-2'-O)-methyltransferase [Bacilli bacterium]|nr:16S rRNA (cytidine(1402)-2'-O)-methyltransferase [Bacilli bacterium]